MFKLILLIMIVSSTSQAENKIDNNEKKRRSVVERQASQAKSERKPTQLRFCNPGEPPIGCYKLTSSGLAEGVPPRGVIPIEDEKP